ncbi:ABC transporter substrate-binding protein [Leisingera thetidis]|uniref:ABC transporter substrate-binding protein n=1 Tax=Leisingera thetidis TaxID=2930199 RepID=UPI0021F7C8A4|nr:ABC transporter substrate-binding protein [Leisingera thetidis]
MKLKSALMAAGMIGAVLAGAPPALAGKADNTLTAAFARGLATTDGLYSTTRENDILGLLIDDALFYVDPAVKKPVPLVADSYEFTDETTLVVKLRSDVTFHDGSPLTAADVVYSFQHIVRPEAETKFGQRIAQWMESVEAVDPQTVIFRMKAPNAMVLYDLSYYSKLRKAGSYEVDGVTDPDAQMTLNLGTGPYRVAEFLPGEKVVLDLYDNYRAGSPKDASIARLVIRFIPDEATQVAEVMSGGVDWTFGISSEMAENVAGTGRAQFLTAPSLRVGYLSLDAAGRADETTPLRDLRVRQALNHAVNHEELVASITGGSAKVARTPCHSLQFGCDQGRVRYGYDPDKAKALLAEAGYPDGFEIDLWAARDRPLQEAVIAYWAKIGVRANLRYVKSISKDRNAGKLSLYYDTWGSYSIPDAGAIIPDLFDLKTPKVYTGDEALSKLVLSTNQTYDQAEREAKFSQAIQTITEQAYWVPIQEYPMNFLYSNDLEFSQPDDGMQRLFLARWK